MQPEPPRSSEKKRATSAFERFFGAALMVLIFPLFACVAVTIRLILGRPVFFKQQRTGLRGRAFEVYKFRTMKDVRCAEGEPLPDEHRLTRLGELLRRFSLDELPQLINVVRGEMSFVGPRPLLHKYWTLGLYDARQKRRFEIKPGLTGWVQVNGRNSLSWEEKFNLDVWYVDNRSIWLDIRILALTGAHVLLGRGISQDGHVTAEEFKGLSDTQARA